MILDLIHEIRQTLGHNKLRTALTGLAVAWGIFMLIILLSLANGLVNGFQRNMLDRDSNTMTVWGGMTSQAFKGYKEGRLITLKSYDTQTVEEADPQHIGKVVGVVTSDTTKFVIGENVLSNGYQGVEPWQIHEHGLDMLAGRFINEADMEEQRKSLVIRDDNARLLFPGLTPEQVVGKRVRGAGLSWVIVGVYSHQWEGASFVPFTTAVALAGNDPELSRLNVSVGGNLKTKEDGRAVEQSVREALAKRHDFSPTDPNAVWVNNRFSQRLDAQDVMNILIVAMWVIGILTLLSGIVGVSNIMFVSVKERTHELGIRRALGAPRHTILIQVVAESVAITTLAGYVGVVLGTAVMALVSNLLGNNVEMIYNPSVDLSVALEVTIVLIVAGALAGLFPALKATKVKPVEALRYE